MNTQTSLVAEQVRLQQWAEQIKDCQSRPSGVKVDTWCSQNGITTANYYYRLRRVREACLAVTHSDRTDFVELPVPKTIASSTSTVTQEQSSFESVALLHTPNGFRVDLSANASAEFIQKLIGALTYAK